MAEHGPNTTELIRSDLAAIIRVGLFRPRGRKLPAMTKRTVYRYACQREIFNAVDGPDSGADELGVL